jgi:superfamily I DNA and/or RNA helicase
MLASKLFYQDSLEALNREIKEFSEPFNKNIIFINSIVENNYKYNLNEIDLVELTCKHLVIIEKIHESDIGIIAPFRMQCVKLRDSVHSTFPDIDIDTVERFQGSERKLIIFSFSVNRLNDIKKIISPKEIDGSIIDRKLNVAITRAKELLILIGNESILTDYIVFKDMLDIIKKNYIFLQEKEYKEKLNAKT